jgi:hypothetical protein
MTLTTQLPRVELYPGSELLVVKYEFSLMQYLKEASPGRQAVDVLP